MWYVALDFTLSMTLCIWNPIFLSSQRIMLDFTFPVIHHVCHHPKLLLWQRKLSWKLCVPHLIITPYIFLYLTYHITQIFYITTNKILYIQFKFHLYDVSHLHKCYTSVTYHMNPRFLAFKCATPKLHFHEKCHIPLKFIFMW